jgi:hypothetical protein
MREVRPSLYGKPSQLAPLSWEWVDGQLRSAGTYWVVSASAGHPRPVWGVWLADRLHLSIGSPVLIRELARDPTLTVHLDSGTDVVIVEGATQPGAVTDDVVVAAYSAKYGSDYEVAQFGDLTQVVPVTVIAWQAAGWAGKGGFRAAGKWLA